MAREQIVVTCECGLEVRGDVDDVVAKVQEHGRDAHNMDVTRDQVLAMAKPDE
jgi:predicted small metal-binding protein